MAAKIKLKIKKGDEVIVVSGRDAGLKGNVLKILPKERRALELLRDRKFEEWKQRLNKAETNELDDLSNARAARDDHREEVY